MQYDKHVYIPPPRPETKIEPDLLSSFEKRGWWAQVKKNGTCSVVFVPPRKVGEPYARTRHGDEGHKAWSFTEKSLRGFKAIQNDHWNVFTAELLHSKGTGTKDTNYVHDVLVCNGTYLLGKTMGFRQEVLSRIFKTDLKKGPTSHVRVDENLWVAKNHLQRFRVLYNNLTSVEDEGLVLKNPNAPLEFRGNSSWQVKCRKPHELYSF